MKVIVAGGRDYQFTEQDYAFLDWFADEISEIVCGGATGADECGKQWAIRNSVPVKMFKADWKTYGKAAGPIRNGQMAEYADALILFPGGRGTDSMHQRAMTAGILIVDRRSNPTTASE
ncbi:SLOG family protein [Roseiconus lacunae]|uniref:SLOG family protein n=1 Tax=Roseiconus lacunae TaxID=2605694 RepID=UPI001E367D5B|nr:SLOG family protein [Roseiconus lacunae]MCD0459157.1 SLOG family protein [Roseiconus lacunae]